MTPRRLGTGLAPWAAGFAVVHVAWALGWRGWVPDDTASIADRPVFLVYDLAAAVLVLGAAYVAARLAHGGLPHRTRHRLLLVTVVGSAAALLRGVPALLVDVATGTWAGLGPAVDVWFTVAGVVGLALCAAVRRQEASDLVTDERVPTGAR